MAKIPSRFVQNLIQATSDNLRTVRIISDDFDITTESNPMEKKFLDILVCPVTKGKLEYHQDKQELWSRQAKLAYPIRDGIPYMLENEARPLSEEELKA